MNLDIPNKIRAVSLGCVLCNQVTKFTLLYCLRVKIYKVRHIELMNLFVTKIRSHTLNIRSSYKAV